MKNKSMNSRIFLYVCLAFASLGPGMKEAVGADLIANYPEEWHTLDLEQGQLQDWSIPAGFVGTLKLWVEGGDGGNGRAESTLGTAFGVGGPGARANATFDVGPGSNRIHAGSTLRFIIGHKGKSKNEIIVNGASEPAESVVNSSQGGGGGGGTAVYSGANLLVGAGGGGGGSAIMAGKFGVIVPFSADGRYGRYIADGYGTTLNGGEGGGSSVLSGNGGVYLPLVDEPGWTQDTGGTGGEEGAFSGGGGGTASGGLTDFIFVPDFNNPTGFDLSATNWLGGGQATHMKVSLGGGTYIPGVGLVTPGDGDGGSGWGGGGAGAIGGNGEGGGGGGLSGGGGGGYIGGGGGGGSAYTTGYGSRGQVIVKRAGRSETRLPQDGRAAYSLIPAYTPTPSVISRNADSGTVSVQVSSTGIDPTAPWTASVVADWLRINHVNQVSGTGPATLQISFSANTTGAERNGTIIIANQPLTVTQSALGSGSMSEVFAITRSETIPPGYTWTLDAGSVLSIEPGTVFTVEAGSTLINSGTIVNKGTIRIEIGGSIVNQANGIISSTHYIYNFGTIQNHGDIFDPAGKYTSSQQPAPNDIVPRHYYLGPDEGGAWISRFLRGAVWDDTTSTCTVDDFWLIPNTTVEVGAGVTLVVNGTLSNDGTLINAGIINNAAGTVKDCGIYIGPPPVPNGLGACTLSADQAMCQSLGGDWNPLNDSCYVNSDPVTIATGETLTINPGATFYMTVPFTNNGTLVNNGSLINQSYMENNGRFENYGEWTSSAVESGDWPSFVSNTWSGTILNYGSYENIELSVMVNDGNLQNFGTLIISGQGGVVGEGFIENRCGSTYTFSRDGGAPPEFPEISFEDCAPSITLYGPSLDVLSASTVTINWEDDDHDSSATVDLFYRDYRNTTTNSAVLIAAGIAEDPDGAADQHHWNLDAVPSGSYTVYAVIRDDLSEVVSLSAAGVVTVLPEGGLTLSFSPTVVGDGLTFNWPANLKGLTLESAAELAPNPNWRPVASPAVEQDGQMVTEELMVSTNKFYRLKLQ